MAFLCLEGFCFFRLFNPVVCFECQSGRINNVFVKEMAKRRGFSHWIVANLS